MIMQCGLWLHEVGPLFLEVTTVLSGYGILSLEIASGFWLVTRKKVCIRASVLVYSKN